MLLFDMDRLGIEAAVLICASIGTNTANQDYAFGMAEAHPGRFLVFPDLECNWFGIPRRTGAAGRLEAALARWSFPGFTVYLDENESGAWLEDADAAAFFGLAAEKRLIVSLSAFPHQMGHVAALAERQPDLAILLHHFGFFGPRSGTEADDLGPLRHLALLPNVYVKYSGMGNIAGDGDDEYPYPRLRWISQALSQFFGPARTIWGSDWPVSQRHMTYRQSLELLRQHGPFTVAEQEAVLGGNFRRLLAAARA